ACRRLVGDVAGGRPVELLAVDVGSHDNSHALLALLRAELAELRVLPVDVPERGVAAAVQAARGEGIALVDPEAARAASPASAAALERIEGALDVVVLPDAVVVARAHAGLLAGVDLRAPATVRRLAQRAARAGLAVEVVQPPRARATPRP